LIPLAIAFLSVILRWITDMTCSPYSQICKAGSDLFSHIYAAVFCFLAIIAATKAQQIKGVLKRFQSAWDVMNTPASTGGVKTKSD
jgi:hypothetical protein